MSEQAAPTPEQNNTPDKKKRSYVSRKDEFIFAGVDSPEANIEKVQEIIKDISTQLHDLNEKLKATPSDEGIKTQVKELTNKRVRAYTRLRSLGHNSKELRAKKTPVAASPESTTPPTPEATTPPATN